MNHKFEKRAKRIYAMLSCFVLIAIMTVCPAFAADDPLAVVTNLSDFIFSLCDEYRAAHRPVRFGGPRGVSLNRTSGPSLAQRRG